MFDEFTQIHKQMLDNMTDFLELQKAIFEDYQSTQNMSDGEMKAIRESANPSQKRTAL